VQKEKTSAKRLAAMVPQNNGQRDLLAQIATDVGYYASRPSPDVMMAKTDDSTDEKADEKAA